MRRLTLALLCLLCLAACHRPNRTEQLLGSRQAAAEQQMNELAECIVRHTDIDSVQLVASRTDGVYFFFFHNNRLIYWSDNSLNIDGVRLPAGTDWQSVSFRNATGVVKQRNIGALNMVAAIPIAWTPVDSQSFADSYSYRPIQEDEARERNFWRRAYLRTRIFYLITILLLLAGLIVLIVNLVRARRFHNLSLPYKITTLLWGVLLLGFIYIFAMSVLYLDRHYTRRQQQILQQKTQYIRYALQQSDYQDLDSDSSQVAILQEELQRLAQIYRTDIHIYDATGFLLASSTPQLFEQGLLTPYIATDIRLTGSRTHEPAEDQVRTELINDKPYLTAYTPFMNRNGQTGGMIEVPAFLSKDRMAQERDKYILRLMPAYLIAMLLSLLLSFYCARLLTKPLMRLKRSMQQYRLGETPPLIEYAYKDEIGLLVQQYNALLQQVSEASARIAQAEKESAWRTMARQVAHEINNTLTPMKLTLQQLQRTKNTERFDAYFEKSTAILIEQIDNLSHIATAFSTIAKMPVVKSETVDIAQKLTNVIALHEHNEQHIPIRYIGPNNGIYARTDNEQILQVFTNIIRNALQALENRPDGDIIVRLNETDEHVQVAISDNGEGIAPEVRDKIFTPNFTTKTYGTGMGLVIAKHIVQSSGGTISFQTSGSGTTFLLTLPKAQQEG